MQLFSIVFSRMINVFYSHSNSHIRDKTLEFMGYFFLIGVVSGLCMWLQPYFFSRSVRVWGWCCVQSVF